MRVPTKENLLSTMKQAEENGAEYIAIFVEKPNTRQVETIINSGMTIEDNVKWYEKTYDENLYHNNGSGVRIVGFCFGDSFTEIEIALKQTLGGIN